MLTLVVWVTLLTIISCTFFSLPPPYPFIPFGGECDDDEGYPLALPLYHY